MLHPPRFLFIDINKRCNLRCQHCLYWRQDEDDRENYISRQRRTEIFEEFAEMNPQGTVVLCGGEKMLDCDNYFSASRTCQALGLKCFSVVNGTRIQNAQIAEQMIREGPSEITISLNSHLPEVHDRTRGMVGSYAKAVTALRLLLVARERLNSAKPVYAMAVICEQNYRELDPFYAFVLNDIGADKLKLNFLQPTFGAPSGFDDLFFEQNVIKDPAELVSIIKDCDKKYGLNINPKWLQQVAMYHQSIQQNQDARRGWGGTAGTREHICNSYERNIMVDLYGNARLCFSSRFPSLRLLQRGNLRFFWESSYFIRQMMKNCNAYCGISHSVRRENATLKINLECPLDT